MTTDNLTPNALRKWEAQSRAEQLAEFILPLREAAYFLRQFAATRTAERGVIHLSSFAISFSRLSLT